MEDRRKMERSDVEILLRLKDGDETAFETLVERFERRLIGYFLGMCGDRQLAEDCAQEVFLRVYRARSSYTPDAAATTFLFRIARNYWIDVYRSRRSRPQEHEIEGPEDDSERPLLQLESAGPRPDEGAAASEDEVRLEAALQKLSEGQKQVIELAVRQQLRYEDVAAILGIPVGTVKSRVHGAVQHLRDLFGVARPRREP
jgi:RNA polymerase sigma-70 factor (ECF subfamily)